MLSKTIEKALNEQIQEELYSAHIYLSMAAYCDNLNLPGFAHWFRTQSEEERAHGMKLYSAIVDRGGRVVLGDIKKPPTEFKSVLAVMEQSLAHEQKVSASIHKIYTLAQKEDDYATQVMLQWFISEQVEEEASVSQIVERLKLVGEKSASLLYFDKELGKRGKE
ncbi:MAG: ferritin [Deltaproteobacteria bacterium]|nr:ferritin [Deltaproteobacteria bacterium]